MKWSSALCTVHHNKLKLILKDVTCVHVSYNGCYKNTKHAKINKIKNYITKFAIWTVWLSTITKNMCIQLYWQSSFNMTRGGEDEDIETQSLKF